MATDWVAAIEARQLEAFRVVFDHPVCCLFTNFSECPEQVQIENFVAVGLVEPLDIRVLPL